MGKILSNTEFPTVEYGQHEQTFIHGYVNTILTKKKIKGNVEDRIAAELAEASVDLYMESIGLDRFWSRGKIHYDFSNLDKSVRLEVKTRKKYLNDLYKLDVRLDTRDVKNGQDATHFVPTIYYFGGNNSYFNIMPGVLSFPQFINGCEKHKGIIPKDFKLKYPSTRCPWDIIFEHPEDFGYMSWSNFETLFKV